MTAASPHGSPMEPPRLVGERVVLRGFRDSDIADRAACGVTPDIVRGFGGTPEADEWRPLGLDQAKGWYDHVSGDGPLHWAIEHDGRFVGTARLHHLNEADRKARYAVGILDRTALGRGLGQEVTRLALRYAFDGLALHRVDLRVLAFNERAIRCYRRVGFVEEGREREAAWVDGAWHDDVIMGLLRHELALD